MSTTTAAFTAASSQIDCSLIDFAQGDYTIEGWFKTASTMRDILSATGRIPDDAGQVTENSARAHGILLEICSDGTLRYLHRSVLATSGGMNVYSPAAVNDNKWHHFAAVRDGNAMRLYLDGVEVSTSASAPDAFTASLEVILGRLRLNVFDSDSRGFEGQLSDLRIWTEARSQSALLDHMHRRLRGDESGLAGYWPLDGSAVDRQAGGNHAIPSGVSWALDSSVPMPGSQRTLSLAFDGQAGHVQIPGEHTALQITDELTIEAWVKLSRITGRARFAVSKNGETDYYLKVRGAHSPNQAGYVLFGSSALGEKVGFRSVDDGRWHHIAPGRTGRCQTVASLRDRSGHGGHSGPAIRRHLCAPLGGQLRYRGTGGQRRQRDRQPGLAHRHQ